MVPGAVCGRAFEPNHVVSRINGPDWAAKAAGVDWPAGLVAVDGVPLAPTDDVRGRLARPLGEPVALTFAARYSGATFTLTVPVQAPALFDFASLFVVPYVVALVFAGLGLWAGAVMALFNAPDPQPDHTLRAVRAALDMQARLARHRATQTIQPTVHFGVAFTVGEAIVGNVGSAELFNYTAMGDVVNLAKRLQKLAAPGQILLSQGA